ncbi:MAG: dienelactone hydrolase family protein, partial [Myxococcota bacterium]
PGDPQRLLERAPDADLRVEAERVARVNVRFASGGDEIAGALYAPDTDLPRPGVLIVHDVWGLYDQYHAVAQRLARAGFAALALDLYARGEQPGSPADMPGVMKFLHRLPDRRVLADIQAAVDFLAARPEVAGRKVGLTGFCMGGKYAFLAASRCRGLSAVVPWYGMLRAASLDAENPEHALDAIGDLRCPLLAFFGAEDVLIPLRDVEELRSRATAQALPVETVIYTGAGHAFANDARPESYRAGAAEDAWRRALAFLSRELAGKEG